jgi:DNA repair exonuclease SbcCD nuclease subunit
MINRIIHFSDLHLKLFKDHDLYRGILETAFKEWKTLQPCRIVFTGDLLHSKNQLTPEAIEISSWVLTECSKITKTILIPGNHDANLKNDDRLDSITPIVNNLNNSNIVYYKDRGIYEDENVSWCVFSQFQGNIPPEIDTAIGFKIGLFHDPVQGLTTDLGFDFGEHAYDTEKFNGLDIVLCGDIHKRAIFNIPNGKRGVMCGSFVQQNFGESVGKHGYGVYDINTDEYSFVDLPNSKPYLKFSIDSFDCIEKGTEKLMNNG